MSKYRAKPQIVNGIRFDSKREANRYVELTILAQAGEITSLTLQTRFRLRGPLGNLKYPTGRVVTYVADFTYFEGEQFVVEDCKGVRTPVYKIKAALMAQMGYPIRET